MSRDPAPVTLQEQRSLFFERLGYALGQWQLVEMQLFRVYARLLRAENGEVASASFYSVISFLTRLDMTEAAARVALADQPRISICLGLLKRARRRSKRRNLLAHFVVVYGVNQPSPAEHGPFLQPSIFDITREPLMGGERLNAARLRVIGDSFERLSNDLRMFADSLPALASSLGRLI